MKGRELGGFHLHPDATWKDKGLFMSGRRPTRTRALRTGGNACGEKGDGPVRRRSVGGVLG